MAEAFISPLLPATGSGLLLGLLLSVLLQTVRSNLHIGEMDPLIRQQSGKARGRGSQRLAHGCMLRSKYHAGLIRAQGQTHLHRPQMWRIQLHVYLLLLPPKHQTNSLGNRIAPACIPDRLTNDMPSNRLCPFRLRQLNPLRLEHCRRNRLLRLHCIPRLELACQFINKVSARSGQQSLTGKLLPRNARHPRRRQILAGLNGNHCRLLHSHRILRCISLTRQSGPMRRENSTLSQLQQPALLAARLVKLVARDILAIRNFRRENNLLYRNLLQHCQPRQCRGLAVLHAVFRLCSRARILPRNLRGRTVFLAIHLPRQHIAERLLCSIGRGGFGIRCSGKIRRRG